MPEKHYSEQEYNDLRAKYEDVVDKYTASVLKRVETSEKIDRLWHDNEELRDENQKLRRGFDGLRNQ